MSGNPIFSAPFSFVPRKKPLKERGRNREPICSVNSRAAGYFDRPRTQGMLVLTRKCDPETALDNIRELMYHKQFFEPFFSITIVDFPFTASHWAGKQLRGKFACHTGCRIRPSVSLNSLSRVASLSASQRPSSIAGPNSSPHSSNTFRLP